MDSGLEFVVRLGENRYAVDVAREMLRDLTKQLDAYDHMMALLEQQKSVTKLRSDDG